MKRLSAATPLFRIVLLGLLFGAVACSDPAPPLLTVDGPEDDTLLQRVTGYMLVVEGGQLEALSLPGLKALSVRHTPPVYAISGLDERGRFIYVENDAYAKKHRVRMGALDGSLDDVILERNGDAIWDRVIGFDLAISPQGDQMAFVGHNYLPELGPRDAHKRAGLLRYGEVELWRVSDRARIGTQLKAVDRGLAFLAGGQHLVFTGLQSRGEVAERLGVQKVGGGFEDWTLVPVVMIFDIGTGKTEFLGVGWSPVVSPDGEYVLISDLNKEYTLIGLRTKQARRVTVPGDWAGIAIALVSKDLVLYWGLPTTGSEQPLAPKFSPLKRAQRMVTYKIASLDSGRFKTVMAPVDGRWQVAFGTPSPGPRSAKPR